MRETDAKRRSSAFSSNDHRIFEEKARANKVTKSQNYRVETACISDIFLQRQNSLDILRGYIRGKNALNTDFKEKLLIYPNMVEIRPTNSVTQSSNPGTCGKRDIIKEFSKKSRREFIKFLCKIKDKLHLWQDMTFADDVMQNKSERKEVSNKALNRFRRRVLEKYSAIKIVYKREWVQRKSGNLTGEHIPHFHMLISTQDFRDDHDISSLPIELAKLWVDCTGTKEIMKSLSVALHSKSYRKINNQKHALKYATKYVTKPDGNWTDESIGRSWGTIGKFDIATPEGREMTPDEMVHIKRIFRRTAPKRHFIQKALRKKQTPTFLIIKDETVNRIIEHTQSHLENECRDFFNSGVPDELSNNPSAILKAARKRSKVHQEQPTIEEGQTTYRLRRYKK